MKIINRGFLDSWIHGSRTSVLLIEIKKRRTNVKKLFGFCFLFVIIFTGFTLSTRAQSLELNFEYITVNGTVVDASGTPVPDIKLEVELATDRELRSEITMASSNLEEMIRVLKRSVGTGVWTTVTSDENGKYAIKGVPVPGVYHIILRNNEKYLPTFIKVSLNAADKKEFPAPNMIVTPRTAGGADPGISDKAMKEVEKSRKAMAENNTKKGIKHMLKALEIEPDYAEGHYNLAVMYMSAKKRDDAVKHLEKAAELQENYKPALKTLGELYLFNKDYEKAVNYLIRYMNIREKEANLTVEDAKYYFQIANCYRAAEHPTKAVPYFEQYINTKQRLGSLEQKDAILCSDIASYYFAKRNWGRAIIYYKKTIKTNPGINPEIYMYLGNSYVGKRDGKSSIPYYEKYLELAPKGQFIPQVKAMLEKLKKMYPDKVEEKK
jgi:tetratricopeptide (TPR) repeat protein